jgi:hypothetical protein
MAPTSLEEEEEENSRSRLPAGVSDSSSFPSLFLSSSWDFFFFFSYLPIRMSSPQNFHMIKPRLN